ncbi:MAG: DNA translocase FtsK 4TM domain-containing protein [Ignavibacteriae bacterium]|nr:DNA translocase FtsK 4TM domain-containing protein [Ignavibacteriota bacterium]
MVLGLFSFLSIIFYNEEGNSLGIVGKVVSDFFVNATVGFASIALASLMVMWGWVALRKLDKRKPVIFTNYTLIFVLLFSTAMGISNLVVGDIRSEWFGAIGGFSAEILVELLGSIGSSIIVVTLMLVTIILAVDLDIHKSLERLENLWKEMTGSLSKKSEKEEVEEESEMEFAVRREEDIEQEEEPEVEDNDEEEEAPPREMEIVVRPHEPVDEEEEEVEPPPKKQPQPKRVVQEVESNNENEVEPLPPAENENEEIEYVFPSADLLDMVRGGEEIPEEELKANAELVRAKLANFGIEIESVSVVPGPVITLYELVPASGVKISRIVSLEDDIALALAAKGIRIIAPIPGKSAVGIEIPNKNPSIVYLKSVIVSNKFREQKSSLPIALGKTISGEVFVDDLSKMPHLLIAGSTGSGKSVGINTILASLLFKMHPSEVKFVIIDPKKIELTNYKRLRQHFLACSPDMREEIITTPDNAVSVLRSVELEMEKRYDRLAAGGVRNLQDYNERLKDGRLKDTETIKHRKMPYIIVVIDELADLMITAAKEVEEPIARLAQLARAVGIHLILATQRPSVDVITGVIKANFPARIAFQVASKTDSRTILDMNGAEQLLGSGDMLYLPSGSPKPTRIQNAFISSDEVERLTNHIAKQQGYSKPFMLPSIVERKSSRMGGTTGERDEFFEEAASLVVRHQQGSVSLIQRRLKVGYSRAARLIDELEAAGIVGPFDGSKARQVLVENEEQLERILENPMMLP